MQPLYLELLKKETTDDNMEELTLNSHNKQEYPPMHTAEHILNQTMVRLFGCPRSKNAHIERKKSKCDYELNDCPPQEQIDKIEQEVNKIISQSLPVTIHFISQEDAKSRFDLERLPEDVSEMLRIVKVGEYDTCLCIGTHVNNTSEIGLFKISSHDYKDGIFRLRFKLV